MIVNTATTRQAGRTPQTRASGPVDSSPSSEFSSPMNLLISVGDSGYSRQVDTEPVGIDIGAIPVHTVSCMMFYTICVNGYITLRMKCTAVCTVYTPVVYVTEVSISHYMLESVSTLERRLYWVRCQLVADFSFLVYLSVKL